MTVIRFAGMEHGRGATAVVDARWVAQRGEGKVTELWAPTSTDTVCLTNPLTCRDTPFTTTFNRLCRVGIVRSHKNASPALPRFAFNALRSRLGIRTVRVRGYPDVRRPPSSSMAIRRVASRPPQSPVALHMPYAHGDLPRPANSSAPKKPNVSC